jgi:hypothetical protein
MEVEDADTGEVGGVELRDDVGGVIEGRLAVDGDSTDAASPPSNDGPWTDNTILCSSVNTVAAAVVVFASPPCVGDGRGDGGVVAPSLCLSDGIGVSPSSSPPVELSESSWWSALPAVADDEDAEVVVFGDDGGNEEDSGDVGDARPSPSSLAEEAGRSPGAGATPASSPF